MIVKVTLYRETGLSPGNCADNLETASTFSSEDPIVFEGIALKQTRGIVNIKLNTTYDIVKDVDYAIISYNNIDDEGYWVTSINMLNDNVADIGLTYDALTSIGTNNILNISGWAQRLTPYTDYEFANNIPEPFVPSRPFVVDLGNEMKPSSEFETGNHFIVLATVNLEETIDTSKLYAYISGDEQDAGSGCFVPEIPKLTGDDLTYYTFFVPYVDSEGNLKFEERESVMAGTAAFNLSNTDIKSDINDLYQLSLDNTIVTTYILPFNAAQFVDDTEGTDPKSVKRFSKIRGNFDATITMNTTPIYEVEGYTVKNKKAYSGQFNKYGIFSILSGESVEFDIDQLVTVFQSLGNEETGEGSTTTEYTTFVFEADPRYNGKPVLYPANYKGSPNLMMMNAVTGAEWQRMPIGTWQAGTAMKLYNYRKQLDTSYSNAAWNLGSSAGLSANINPSYTNQTALGGIDMNTWTQNQQYTTPGSMNIPVLSFLKSLINQPRQILQNESRYQDANQMAYAAPQINFPIIPSLQDFIGNTFFDYATHLSAEDTKRFDAFLTGFGYAVDEPLRSDVFGCRKSFEYIKAYGVSLNTAKGTSSDKQEMIRQLEGGVRIWHVKPSYNFYTIDNSIVVKG